jgi:hypothetical protein
MASLRTSLRNALLFEEGDKLVVGKLIPNEWVDKMITYEEPIIFENSATEFGNVDVRYDFLFSVNTVLATVKFKDQTRFPKQLEVRGNYSAGVPVSNVTVNGETYDVFDKKLGSVVIETKPEVIEYVIKFKY